MHNLCVVTGHPYVFKVQLVVILRSFLLQLLYCCNFQQLTLEEVCTYNTLNTTGRHARIPVASSVVLVPWDLLL
jgi:hypothetical protein